MARTIPVQDGAEALVELLVSSGVKHVFINSGTDTFPVLEAIARMVEQERLVPQVIQCLDERTAMAAAHGYYQATGVPQVAMVHVDAGTMNIGGAYHNAQRDHAGVVVMAGRAPATIASGVHGERDNLIHWGQEQRDQAGPVRTFTKWDYELRRPESMHLVIRKAFQTASASPAGPVYLMLPRELLLGRMETVPLPEPSRHAAPVTPAADPAALAKAAGWLLEAERPVIFPGAVGRNPAAVPALVSLAEALGAAVATDRARPRMSFPSTHPLFMGADARTLAQADVVLVLDADVPWIPGKGGPGEDARIIWVDEDPAKDTIPLWTFAADLLIHADTAKALPALRDAVLAQRTSAQEARGRTRAAAITAAAKKVREGATEKARQTKDTSPITPDWLAACLNEALSPETVLLMEAVSSSGEVSALVERTVPGTLYQSGGSSLGWAMGAAIGHKLADPSREVVALVGDGTFVFSAPTACLWGAERHGTPFLTVIFNNAMHYATKRALRGGVADSASERTGRWEGIDITPSPDYAVLAQASRAYGEKVEDPNQVPPALQRALEQVRAGRCAVLDVRIKRF
ncbi:MAG: thiamine pyrophosphate-requiring protein [Chloroflexota bacterium]